MVVEVDCCLMKLKKQLQNSWSLMVSRCRCSFNRRDPTMNNQTQIMEAMRDYQMGKMGVLIE